MLNTHPWQQLHTLRERAELLTGTPAEDLLALYEPVNRLVKMKLASTATHVNKDLLTPIEVDVNTNLEAFEGDQYSDFSHKLAQLISWRQPIHQLFETLLVNDPDAAIKNNRHRLLLDVLACYEQLADFTAFEAIVAQSDTTVSSRSQKSFTSSKAG
ncbi:MAG: hypothetical protein U0003_03560 [Vampirovibrionales bacterium]